MCNIKFNEATFLCSLMRSVRKTAAANNKLLTAGHGFAMSRKECVNLPRLIYLSLNNLLLLMGEPKMCVTTGQYKVLHTP